MLVICFLSPVYVPIAGRRFCSTITDTHILHQKAFPSILNWVPYDYIICNMLLMHLDGAPELGFVIFTLQTHPFCNMQFGHHRNFTSDVTFILLCVQIFASDSFLELTEYTREEILGRNCRYELFSECCNHLATTFTICFLLHSSGSFLSSPVR